jgi:cytochrome oxidase assembly protein ShyY1
MVMGRLLLKPKWAGLTLAVIAAVVLCLFAARWQWDRYQFKVDRKERVEQALAAAPQPIASAADAEIDEWTVVAATGRFDAENQIVILGRSQGGAAGVQVIAPLVLADGSVIVVNRGFTANGSGTVDPAAIAAPPPGAVTVIGPVRPSQKQGAFGAADPATGDLDVMNRIDLDRIAKQLNAPVAATYIEADSTSPDLQPVALPTPSLGNHLSYVGQWILFAILAVVGWWVLVRRGLASERKAANGVSSKQPAVEPTAG